MDRVSNFLLQRLDDLAPDSRRQENILLRAPIVVIEDDIRVDLLAHFVDVIDLVVCDHAQQLCHFFRVFQIAAQRVFHAHQMMRAFKQAAAEQHTDEFFLAVRLVGGFFCRAPVQPSRRGNDHRVLPVFNVLDDRVFCRHMRMRTRRTGLINVGGSPRVFVFLSVLREHTGHQNRVGNQLNGVHQIEIIIRLLMVVDRHCVFA